MTGIGTNVLVRHLVDDDPSQFRACRQLFRKARVQGERIWIATIVLCETVWTLRCAYGYSRSEVLEALQAVLDADLFDVEAEGAVRAALGRTREGKGDFADYLIGEMNMAHGCRATASFDRALRGCDLFFAP